MKEKKSICIVGAGISGLTCAHELSQRGFDIVIYEQSNSIGGKAKSGWSTKGYPTEHGHRFYGGYDNFYQTMEQLKTIDDKSVKNNLTPAPFNVLFKDYKPITYSSTFSLLRPIHTLMNLLKFTRIVGFRNMFHFVKQLLLFLKGNQKYIDHLRNIDFQSLISSNNKEDNFYRFIGRWSQFLWGVRAGEINAYSTISSIAVSNLRHLNIWKKDFFYPVMNGPSSESLFNYWKKWLDKSNVVFYFEHKLLNLEIEGYKIKKLTFDTPQGAKNIQADYYVIAVPCENLSHILTENNKKKLDFDDVFSKSVYPFNGVQLYLQNDYFLLQGLSLYSDTSWCITACLQNKEIWSNHYFKPPVTGILSVVLADWNSPGILYNKSIMECTKIEIIEEIVAQLGVHQPIQLQMSNIFDYFIDDAVHFSSEGTPTSIDSKLYATPIGKYYQQYDNKTVLENLFLAGDYTKTHMINGTMENANISGKLAANAVIQASGVPAKLCTILDNSYFKLTKSKRNKESLS